MQSLDKICDQRDLIEDPYSNQEGINSEDIERLEIMLKSLSEKRQAIIRMRFGLGGTKPLTLQEISERVNLSRERVRQIIKESLGKMRDLLQSGNDY